MARIASKSRSAHTGDQAGLVAKDLPFYAEESTPHGLHGDAYRPELGSDQQIYEMYERSRELEGDTGHQVLLTLRTESQNK